MDTDTQRLLERALRVSERAGRYAEQSRNGYGKLRTQDALAADALADACAAIRDLTLVVERLAQRVDARD